MAKKDDTAFICNNCGHKVPPNEKVCPNCNVALGDIHCSNCHYEGTDSEFSNGCPKCGFLSDGSEPQGKTAKKPKQLEKKHWEKLYSALILAFCIFVLLGSLLLFLWLDNLQ